MTCCRTNHALICGDYSHRGETIVHLSYRSGTQMYTHHTEYEVLWGIIHHMLFSCKCRETGSAGGQQHMFLVHNIHANANKQPSSQMKFKWDIPLSYRRRYYLFVFCTVQKSHRLSVVCVYSSARNQYITWFSSFLHTARERSFCSSGWGPWYIVTYQYEASLFMRVSCSYTYTFMCPNCCFQTFGFRSQLLFSCSSSASNSMGLLRLPVLSPGVIF